jgi:hypothetical protein
MSQSLRLVFAVVAGAIATAGAVHGSLSLLAAGVVLSLASIVSIYVLPGGSGRSVSRPTGTEQVFVTVAGLFAGLFIGAGSRPDTLPGAVVGVVLTVTMVWLFERSGSSPSR